MERRDYTKVFDVSRPSKSGPDPTSRPVIVGHHPVMSDPMVRPPSVRTDDNVGFDTTQHHAKVIEVSNEARAHIAHAQPPTAEELAAAAEVEEKRASMAPLPSPAMPAQSVAAPSVPGTPLASPQPMAVLPVTQPPLPATSPDPDLGQIQHVPVSHMSVSQSGRLKTISIWIFIIIFLAGFGLYLAIDAGFINVGVNLPFHIFSRSS